RHRRDSRRFPAGDVACRSRAPSRSVGRPHRRENRSRTMPVPVELTPTDPVAGRRTSWRRTELAIALLIFGVGAMVGIRAIQLYRAVGYPEYFYQSDFGPAVMFACGGSLADPDTRNAPALAAFLLQRSDTFDCAALDPTMPMNPMNGFQGASQYLELAVGL